MLGLVGANGAGKTTLFRAIMGLLPRRQNMVRFRGQPIGALPTSDLATLGIAMVPEGRRLFRSLSVQENLRIAADYGRKGHWTLERIYALFPILAEKRHAPALSLSGGQQQMVAIGRALMGRPELLLLDEPSVGIAPRLKGLIFDAIQQIRKDGTAILIVEQDATSTLRITDRVYVLEHGRTIREGTPKDLAGDKYIQQVYLGV